jgi:hypothetical protein
MKAPNTQIQTQADERVANAEKAAAAGYGKKIAALEKDLKVAATEQADTRALKELVGTAMLDLDKLKTPAWVIKPGSVLSPGVPTLQLSDFHWGERVYSKQVNGVNHYDAATARSSRMTGFRSREI